MKEFFPVLRSSQLFSGVSEEELTAMLTCLGSRKAELSQGGLSAALRRHGGVHWSGAVRQRAGHSGGYLGQPQYPLQGGPGQTFAAAYACAPGSVLNVSVVAETSVTVLLMNVKRILNVCPSACTHHSRIIRNLLGELAEKNLRFGEKLTHMGQRTTRAKLMSYFSAEAQRLGTYEFDVPFSRQQLADYLAVERSGLSLELGKMKKDGLLDFHKSHFVLKV